MEEDPVVMRCFSRAMFSNTKSDIKATQCSINV